MPKTNTEETAPGGDHLEVRRRQIRESKARHDARMDELTRLEQAAYKERKILGEEKTPYTPLELREAEAIRALQDELELRVGQLSNAVLQRLEREAARDEGKAALLSRYRRIKGVRLELPAF